MKNAWLSIGRPGYLESEGKNPREKERSTLRHLFTQAALTLTAVLDNRALCKVQAPVYKQQ